MTCSIYPSVATLIETCAHTHAHTNTATHTPTYMRSRRKREKKGNSSLPIYLSLSLSHKHTHTQHTYTHTHTHTHCTARKLLRIYKPTRQLHSTSDTSVLGIRTVCIHSLDQRSFSFAAPAVWNTLPYEIRSSNTISSFKSSLKTYLFQQSY